MASLNENVSLTGKSGNKYLFKAYTIDEECPSESGIYAFAKRSVLTPGALGSYSILYIGMAQSFQSRFYSHHKDKCVKDNGGNSILLKHIPNEKERIDMENDLLAAYATKCNEVNNPITPR